jgi:hypothetical protein
MRVLAAGLSALAVLYTAAGTYTLLTDTPGSFPVDLRLRWVESRLLVRGLNTQTVGHPDPMLPPANEVMRRASGGYPPWSYTLGLAFAPPLDWPLVRNWFAAISLIALAGVSRFAWLRSRPLGLLPAVIAALLPFTSFSNAICLSYGQYGVVVNGLMVASVVLLDRRQEFGAGVMLALALVKPQLSATYCIALAASRRWVAVAVIAACIGLATVIMAVMVSESPQSVMTRALEDMGQTHISSNPALSLAWEIMPRQPAVIILGLAGAVISGLVALRHRTDTFRVASVAMIAAMFWTYRKHFDVPMMSLPLIWLWIEAVRTRRARYYAVFAATGLTLWLPLRDAQWHFWWVQALQLIVWPAAGWLIYSAATWPTADRPPAHGAA